MLFLDIFFGLVIGIVLGLIPNFHMNILAYLLCAVGAFSLFPNSFYLFFSVAISMTITGVLPLLLFKTQTSDSFALFLGQSGTQNLKLTKYQLNLSLYGFLFGGVFAVLFLSLFYFLFILFSDFYIFIFLILFLILVYLLYQDRSLITFLIVVFSGTLGVLTLKYNFFFKDPLLPCIFGLFALPSLLVFCFDNSPVVKDNPSFDQEIISYKALFFNSFFGTVFSCIIAIVPSISPGLSIGLASLFKEKENNNEKLVIFSSTLISVILIYFFMATTFYKSRIGYVSILLEEGVISVMSLPDIFIMCFVFILVIGLTCLFLFYFYPIIFTYIFKFNFIKINLWVIVFSVILIIAITNVWNIYLIVLSCAIGFLQIAYNKNKLLLMSYLIVPTILFFI